MLLFAAFFLTKYRNRTAYRTIGFCGSAIATTFFCDIIATAPQRKNAVAQGWYIGPLTLFVKVPVLGLSVDFWLKGVAVLLKFVLTRLLCSSLPGPLTLGGIL